MTGAGLAVFLERLNWSPERLAREVNRRCGDGTVSPKAPYHWVRGTYPRRGIPDTVAQILTEHLKETVEIPSIWPRSRATPDSPALEQQAAADLRKAADEETPLIKSACASARLVQNVFETNADEAALSRLNGELDDISGSALHVPSRTLIYRAVMLRDRIGRLLQGHQKPAQRRELLSLGAKCCTLLAWMSEDLGEANAAYNQALSAWDLADLADDNVARRWARAVQSRQAYWSRNYVEAAERAADGMTWPAEDGLQIMLVLQSARAWAAAGAPREARAALRTWRDLRDSGTEAGGGAGAGADGTGGMGGTGGAATGPGAASGTGAGLLDLRRDRQHYLAGHTLLTLDEPEEALRELYASLDWLDRLPPVSRFYALEVMARVDITRAHARLGDLDTAGAVMEPVFGLEQEKLITMVLLVFRNAVTELFAHRGQDARIRGVVARMEDLLAESVAG